MFNSIKYRFITIYFLLVLLVMSIVGTIIINRLEAQQLENVTSNMNQTLNSIIRTSNYLSNSDWTGIQGEINNTLTAWRLSPDETIYAIDDTSTPKIIASSNNQNELINGKNALSYKSLNSELIINAFHGESSSSIVVNTNNEKEKHIAIPIFSSDGDVRGVFYMTHNLSNVFGVIKDAKIILTYATIIALFITTILGYFIANSITEPISDLTKKASEMARGNFDQKVDVKSDDEIGNLASMFNYLTTELKHTITEMDLEKSKLDTIFKYMTEGVIAINKNGILIHANPIAKQILSISDKDMYKYFNLEELNIPKLNYKKKKTLQGEIQINIKNSFYKIKYAPFKKDDMTNQGIIIVLQDITKEHKLDNLRKEFVANVSHELKTPITTIKTYTETILDTPDMDFDQVAYFLGVIDRENNRMARLVSDLLQLSNMDYDNFKLNIEKVDTFEILNQAIESLAVLIKEKGHKITLNVPMDVKSISADKHALEQILINIISNAVKYTDQNGKIKISASSNLFNVYITVEDNGLGIPKEDLNRIFERFYRVEKGRSRAMGGTGLGLSIAKQMTQAMGGDIKIDSEYGKGTKVTMIFNAYR